MNSHKILENKVKEKHNLKITNKVDVIVCGGGPSGLVAAVAAAREGADVILIERNSFLGGVATSGMMAALVGSHWATGIGLELIEKMAEKNGAPFWDDETERTATTPFDPEIFKEVALELVQEADVNLVLNTWVSEPIVIDKEVKGVIIENKSGRQALIAKTVIDSTGDADLAAKARAPVTKGRETDNKMRPVSLLFRLGGLEINKIDQYVKENPEEIQPQYRHGTHLQVGEEEVISRISGFYRLVEKAKNEGKLYPECHYFRLENLWVQRGTAICNTTRVYNIDGTNNRELTKARIQARKQINKLVEFAKEYIPGCKNAFVIDTATRLGVRETRRIIGEYLLTDDDAYNDAHFDDAIMTMKSSLIKRPIPKNLDVHMPEPIEGSPQDLLERHPEKVDREKHTYQIPYRSLLPKEVDHLLVAGKTISVSHMIDSSTRNMLVCMRIGQVAGTAAAIVSKNNLSPKLINIDNLIQSLKKQGMIQIQ